MSQATKALFDTVLALPEDERNELIGKLLDLEYDEDWQENEFEMEMKRRLDEMQSGEEPGIPWEEARREIFKD
jgi:putative addiction module component (TIGR02574 family)